MPSDNGQPAPRNVYMQQWLQRIFDNTKLAIVVFDKHGRVVYANPAAEVLFTVKQNPVTKMDILQLECGSLVEHWRELQLSAPTERNTTFETIFNAEEGCPIFLQISLWSLEFEAETLWCSAIRTIPEKKPEEQIRDECERRFRRAMDETSDGVWDRDLTTGEAYYGANWASTLGYTHEDLKSGRITWEKLLHPDDKEKTLRTLWEHLCGETRSYDAEFRMRNSKKSWQWIRARGKIIEWDKCGKPLRFIGTHTDITSMKELELSLLKSFEETKMFAYSVAHDLKSPAVAIHSLVKRFSEKVDRLSAARRKTYCEHILNSTNQIVDLVDEINAYISSKEMEKNFEEVLLKEIVRASYTEFAAQLQYRRIKWHEFADNPLIRMDRLSMIRVFRNLIDNSLKYGGPQLSKIWIGYQNTAGFHVVSVQDNGVGMNSEDTERIFQPFKRRSGSQEQQGLGLGLAIVKEIATAHKGEVWIESNRKRGVKFCFAISKDL